VPVKFEIHRANGTVVSPNAAPRWLTPVKGSSLSVAVDESAYSASATSGDVYQIAGQQYMYNWSTKGLPAGLYYRIGVRLDDGNAYTVNLGLRRESDNLIACLMFRPRTPRATSLISALALGSPASG
jgi:hypothetical protein